MELYDGLTFGPGKMFHACGPESERSRRQFLAGTGVEFFAHPEIECAGYNRDMLDLRMCMGWNFIKVRKPEPHGERPLFSGIAFQYRRFRSGRQGWESGLPLDFRRAVYGCIMLSAVCPKAMAAIPIAPVTMSILVILLLAFESDLAHSEECFDFLFEKIITGLAFKKSSARMDVSNHAFLVKQERD